MNNHPISSMTRPEVTPNLDSGAELLSAEPAAEGSELALLARLNAVLRSLEHLLSTGEPEQMPQLCREAASISQGLTSFYAQSLIGSLAQDDERRKTALRELRRRHALCGALLRRCRRILAFREQALRIFGEPVTYTPALLATSEPK